VPHRLALLALSVEGSCEGSFLGVGFLKFVVFLISDAPTVITSEQVLVRPRANFRMRTRDQLLAALESAACDRVG